MFIHIYFFVYALFSNCRIFGQKKKLTAQEMEKRKDEESLFSGSIAGAPSLLSNINDVLQNDDDDLEEEETGS